MGPGMADKPLFNLDTEGRWRLAYDSNQWVLQNVRVLRAESATAFASPVGAGFSFVGGKKVTLGR